MYRTRQETKERKRNNYMLVAFVVVALMYVVVHTVDNRGAYHITWFFPIIPYTMLWVYNRPNYVASCKKALFYCGVMVAPYVGLAILMYILVAVASMIVGK